MKPLGQDQWIPWSAAADLAREWLTERAAWPVGGWALIPPSGPLARNPMSSLAERLGLSCPQVDLILDSPFVQRTLPTRDERVLNRRRAFRCGPVPPGATVLLIDDFMRSGTSLSAAAAAILEAGAGRVWGLVGVFLDFPLETGQP